MQQMPSRDAYLDGLLVGGSSWGHAERAHSNGLPNSQNLNEIVRRALSIEGQSRPDLAFPLGPYSPPHDENACRTGTFL